MRHSIIYLSLLLLPLLWASSTTSSPSPPPPPPRGFYINCGASEETWIDGIKWLTDDGFVESGNKSTIKAAGLLPTLASVRYFPDASSSKYCYTIPVSKGGKYLVRTTYYYGGFDGGTDPPVFDQIVGGTRWSSVNTTENYRNGLTSYYEIVVAAHGKSLSVCLARNKHTDDSSGGSPFISALEVQYLEDSMYNSTNFGVYALSTIARHRFGFDGRVVSYPEDPFNRYWQPFVDQHPVVEPHDTVSSMDFWNLPPEVAFRRAITTSRGKKLVVKWPLFPLRATSYYIALYFQDNRTPSPYSWRVFNISVNGVLFYKNLNVSTAGTMVYATRWPLEGKVEIELAPDEDSPVGPLINAGEIFQVVPLTGRTVTRDLIGMEAMARSFSNRPLDWSGDPCLPKEHTWTGVGCSYEKSVRVVSLNFTNFGLSGSLPDSIGGMSALNSIFLGGNKLTGSIPDTLGSLKQLAYLHLENNQLSGKIPSSLGDLPSIREIHLQNNKLEGEIPKSLQKRTGIMIEVAPGNQIH